MIRQRQESKRLMNVIQNTGILLTGMGRTILIK